MAPRTSRLPQRNKGCIDGISVSRPRLAPSAIWHSVGGEHGREARVAHAVVEDDQLVLHVAEKDHRRHEAVIGAGAGEQVVEDHRGQIVERLQHDLELGPRQLLPCRLPGQHAAGDGAARAGVQRDDGGGDALERLLAAIGPGVLDQRAQRALREHDGVADVALELEAAIGMARDQCPRPSPA